MCVCVCVRVRACVCLRVPACVRVCVPVQMLMCFVCVYVHMIRVDQNPMYTVYIRYFWQGYHQLYGFIRCICTVLANPTYDACVCVCVFVCVCVCD